MKNKEPRRIRTSTVNAIRAVGNVACFETPDPFDYAQYESVRVAVLDERDYRELLRDAKAWRAMKRNTEVQYCGRPMRKCGTQTKKARKR